VQVDLRHPSRQISFRKLSRCRLPDLLPLTVLDAMTCGEELRALFQPEFDLLDVHLSWKGRRTWIRQSMGKVLMSKMSDEKLESTLRIAVDQLPPGCSRALLVTHMAVEQKSLEIIWRLRPDVLWESTHYFTSRGLNEFELCTAVVCFGVPIMNPEATNDSAAYLFPEDPEQQADWIRGQSDSGLYQCAHRGRFVRNPGRALIVMGQTWPEHLLGRPDQTMDRRRNGSPNDASERINEAADRAIPFLDTLGSFTKEVSAWIGIGQADRREKVSRAREALKGLRRDVERSGLSQVYQLL
jgi:hypothetical protein